MKPDWDELGDKFAKSKKVLIGDVDCTLTSIGNDKLCERFGIKGYPTLKVFRPPDRNGEDYKGDRDLASLKAFAKTLGPACTIDTLKKCKPEQLVELQPYLDMPREEVLARMAELKKQKDAVEAEHKALLESLQQQYEASEKVVNEMRERIEPEYKLLIATIPYEEQMAGVGVPAADLQPNQEEAPKDEV